MKIPMEQRGPISSGRPGPAAGSRRCAECIRPVGPLRWIVTRRDHSAQRFDSLPAGPGRPLEIGPPLFHRIFIFLMSLFSPG